MAPIFSSQELPISQRAVVAKSVGKYELISTQALPTLGPNHLMVKVFAVALNPVNWKMIETSPPLGVVGGNDYSGVVCATGADVSSAWKIGDKVCGCVYGLDPTLEGTDWAGSFAEYIAVDANLVMRIPTVDGKSMNISHAASLGIGVMTAGMALYESLQLPMPPQLENETAERESASEFIFIHGGNTATGTIAIQLARLSGYIPITTCSPSNNSKLESLGCAKAFDYNNVSCGNAIRAFTKGKLRLVLDCISDISSMRLCYAALGPKGGKYASLEPPSSTVAATRKNVSTDWVMMLSMFGKRVIMDGKFGRPANPQTYEFAVDWFGRAEILLGGGLLIPHPVRILSGGLGGVINGLEELKMGKVKGEKLVCNVVENQT